jgi:hypothetical protein
MDAAYRTPLVDCFRRGDVGRDIRLLAAAGGVAPRAHEQIALLMLLVEDPDPEVAATANATIARLPAAALAAFLARSEVSSDTRAFFAARGIVPAERSGDKSDAPLIGETPPHLAGAEGQAEGEPAAQASDPARDAAAPDGEGDQRKGTAQRLALLSVSERIKVAMQGTREERGVLVRDPNRLVSSAVLSSPKLTDSEVEAIARMANVSDEVLRIVGTTRTWIKNYNVIAALTRNAKTPIAISLNLLNRLVERDIKMLASDRNVPEPIRVAARKLYVQNQSRRQ